MFCVISSTNSETLLCHRLYKLFHLHITIFIFYIPNIHYHLDLPCFTELFNFTYYLAQSYCLCFLNRKFFSKSSSQTSDCLELIFYILLFVHKSFLNYAVAIHSLFNMICITYTCVHILFWMEFSKNIWQIFHLYSIINI